MTVEHDNTNHFRWTIIFWVHFDSDNSSGLLNASLILTFPLPTVPYCVYTTMSDVISDDIILT